MQCAADSAFTDVEAISAFPHTASIEGNRLNNLALPALQALEKAVNFPIRQAVVLILCTERVHHILDWDHCSPAAATQRVDEFIADNAKSRRASTLPIPLPGSNRSRIALYESNLGFVTFAHSNPYALFVTNVLRHARTRSKRGGGPVVLSGKQ